MREVNASEGVWTEVIGALNPFHVLAVYGSVARRVWLLLVLLLMASEHLVEEVELRRDRASHGKQNKSNKDKSGHSGNINGLDTLNITLFS